MADEPRMSDHGSVPVPDPTEMTQRAVNEAGDQWRREMESLKEIIATRLNAMDRADKLHRKFAETSIANMPILIENLNGLMTEKFKSMDQRFIERDVRTEQTQRASEVSLAAALQAAKELVNTQNESNAKSAEKTETSFTKQIEQIGDLIRSGAGATAQQIGDLKERIDRADGGVSGRAGQVIETREARTEVIGQRNSNNQMLGVVLTAAAILVTILLALYVTKP